MYEASEQKVELDIVASEGSVVGSSNEEDGDGDREWEAFDTAFRGKTIATPSSAVVAAVAAGTAAGTPVSAAASCHSFGDFQEPAGVGRDRRRFASGLPAKASRSVGDARGRGEQLECVCSVGLEGQEEKIGRPTLSTDKQNHRWVDYYGGSSSDFGSSSSGSSGSSGSTKSRAEDGTLLLVEPGERNIYETDPTSPRFAPGYDGEGDPAAPHRRSETILRGRGHYDNATKHTNSKSSSHNHHQHLLRHQPARRLPLSVDTNTSSRRRQLQQQQQHSAEDASTPISRVFAWSVLLHGCLCEAPLAVLEGLSRGPLYLVAAAWVALVALVGTTGHPQHRTELKKHAAALGREGVLFLAAALTLAVPFMTVCSVYGEVTEEEEEAWDVRPVPTPLGGVDPLRFFVFAFGQAGELAANGRPDPLPPQRPAPSLSVVTTEGRSPGSPSSLGDAASDDWRTAAATPPRPLSPSHFFGLIASRSMDTDRFGAGMILHPPHELVFRFRKAGATGRRAAVQACRRLANTMATGYRRIWTLGTAVARLRRRGDRRNAGGLSDAAGSSRSSRSSVVMDGSVLV